MTKDNDQHKDSDTWGRGRTEGNRGGAGAYTETEAEVLKRLKRGDLTGDAAKMSTVPTSRAKRRSEVGTIRRGRSNDGKNW